MDQKYLTDSESLSLNIEATCLLLSSPRNFQYEIKTDKYNPYPSMISMFTSDSQHPPKTRHAVHLGVETRSFALSSGDGKTQFNHSFLTFNKEMPIQSDKSWFSRVFFYMQSQTS